MADEFKLKHRAGTLAQWADPEDGPPLQGEIAVLLDDDGAPLLAKIGDGETAFADLANLGGYAFILDHGADGNVARPGVGNVPGLWRGSAEPTNALTEYDDWLDLS